MLNLLQILKGLSSRYPEFSKRMSEAGALSAWEAAVGSTIVRNTKPLFVKDRKFFVEVPHPLWRAELSRRKNQIIQKLNDHEWNTSKGPEAPIEDIVFVEPGYLERSSERYKARYDRPSDSKKKKTK